MREKCLHQLKQRGNKMALLRMYEVTIWENEKVKCDKTLSIWGGTPSGNPTYSSGRRIPWKAVIMKDVQDGRNTVENNVHILRLQREPILPRKSVWCREPSVTWHWCDSSEQFYRRNNETSEFQRIRDQQWNLKLRIATATESNAPSFPFYIFLQVQLSGTEISAGELFFSLTHKCAIY